MYAIVSFYRGLPDFRFLQKAFQFLQKAFQTLPSTFIFLPTPFKFLPIISIPFAES